MVTEHDGVALGQQLAAGVDWHRLAMLVHDLACDVRVHLADRFCRAPRRSRQHAREPDAELSCLVAHGTYQRAAGPGRPGAIGRTLEQRHVEKQTRVRPCYGHRLRAMPYRARSRSCRSRSSCRAGASGSSPARQAAYSNFV